METLNNENVEKHFPRRETVLLNFTKRELQIVRQWSKEAEKGPARGRS
jgi:hypothetical protein